MMKLADRIRQFGITSRAVIDTGYVPETEWDKSARHYQVTLSRPDYGYPGAKRRLTVSFHQGSAHKKPPTTIEVMSCLLLDASGVADGQSFEEWAEESLYKPVLEQTERLRNFLLDDKNPWKLWLNETDNDY